MTTLQAPSAAQADKCYDNTKVSTYKTCPRKFFIRHQLDWTPTGIRMPLIFGLSWHDAQDIVWGQGKNFSQPDLSELAFLAFKKTWVEQGLNPTPTLEQAQYWGARTPGIAYEMLYNYTTKHWRMIQNCEVIAIEQPFAVPLPGLPGHWYVGRLDKVIGWNAQRIILEHKTTTAYSTDYGFLRDYTESWDMSAQVKGYEFGGNLYFGNLDGVWVDAALVHKKQHDIFKFIPVNHQFSILKEWIEGTVEWVKTISLEEETYREVGKLLPGMFKKNEESCFGKYGQCEYIDICRTQADPSILDEPPPGFVVEKWEPFDILGLSKLVKENTNA